MTTHNIPFCREMRKMITFLSRAMAVTGKSLENYLSLVMQKAFGALCGH